LLLLRDGGNGQRTVIRRKNLDLGSDFRSLAQLQYCGPSLELLRASLVKIDTEMPEKYAEQQHPFVCGKLTLDDMPQDVCQH